MARGSEGMCPPVAAHPGVTVVVRGIGHTRRAAALWRPPGRPLPVVAPSPPRRNAALADPWPALDFGRTCSGGPHAFAHGAGQGRCRPPAGCLYLRRREAVMWRARRPCGRICSGRGGRVIATTSWTSTRTPWPPPGAGSPRGSRRNAWSSRQSCGQRALGLGPDGYRRQPGG